MCASITMMASTSFDIKASKSDNNPLGLVFWQAGVKAQRGLTPDKQAYIVYNPLGLVFHRGRVAAPLLNPATNDISRCSCEL